MDKTKHIPLEVLRAYAHGHTESLGEEEIVEAHLAHCQKCSDEFDRVDLPISVLGPVPSPNIQTTNAESGDVLERFRFDTLIGEGGMGVVHRAFDRRLQRTVAVKRINPQHVDAEYLKRFEEEGKSAAQLVHPNIVMIHDAVTISIRTTI